MAAVTGAQTAPGIADFYRVLLGPARTRLATIDRRRLAMLAEVLFLASYLALRTLDLGRPWLIGWTIAAGILAVVSPASGLTVFVAVAPFSEWLLVDRDTGAKLVLPPLLGLGLLVRLALGRARPRADAAVGLAALLLVGTGLGVVHSTIGFGDAFGFRALVYWLDGLGGGLLVFLAARNAAQIGNFRPIIAATASIAIAALASLADFADPHLVRDGGLQWLMRPTQDAARLTGVIPAPNAVAALLLAGVAVMVAVALFQGVRVRWRLLLLIPIGWSAVAIWLTYSRSGIVGLALLAVVYAIWWRPKIGLAVLAGSAAIALVAIPAYLHVRAAAVGATSTNVLVLSQSDLDRFAAWGAAWRMWLEQPLIGVGSLAFRQLHDAYGSAILTAPHNEVLRLLAEEGPLVAAAFIAFCAAVGVRLWRSRLALALGALGALLALLVAGAFNNPLGYVQVAVPVFTIVGAGLGLVPPSGDRRNNGAQAPAAPASLPSGSGA